VRTLSHGEKMKHELNIADFNIDEIASIEEYGDEETIDITVDDTHMFFLENGVYTHNSGLNAEVVTMEAISEAFNKCFVADFIFSLSRTIADKQVNGGRIFIAKNRNGDDGIVCPVFMDTSNVAIKVFEPTDDSIEDIQRNGAKVQKERLKEKYEAFKTKSKNKNNKEEE